ncbi:hypothetical protein SAMN04515647_3797 [Cohaesibacter sp. ES.047]|nr:hypothetical protein SAMN04515647_3797 [Cohaesibacter sp. ES.047]
MNKLGTFHTYTPVNPTEAQQGLIDNGGSCSSKTRRGRTSTE